MTLYRRSTLTRLGLVLVMLLLAGLACSLSGGDDERDSDTVPTVEATITPPLTKTPIPTFTAFPTRTPTQFFQAFPTATRLALQPTIPFVVPTWTPVVATAYPYDVRISYPVDGSQIAGYISIIGSASHPRFLQYALEWGPDPNPGNLWYPLTAPLGRPVINGALGAWNTTLQPDGQYQIRLHVWLNDGTETFDIVTAIRVSNTRPTAVPTLTSTPRPNRPPAINPVPSQVLNSGQSTRLNVTATDPDGDPVNIFTSSSNPAIAGVQVTAAREINVAGVTAGTATITVTANDNRGGLSSTAFIVTVQGQNRAPTINPVLGQTIEVGQTRDITITASDPDGDPLTVSASSDNANIVTASAPNVSTIRINGVAVGTANVTVTANDGKGGVINTAFQVVVGAVNRPPAVDPINGQTMTVGETRQIGYQAVDPDNDPLAHDAQSDTPNVVTASIASPGVITLVAQGVGPATIRLSVDDGTNDPVIATFNVLVEQGNLPPMIETILPQTMSAGEGRDVGYAAIDPDDDPLDAQVQSDAPNVVTASISAPGVIHLEALDAGTATVTLSVDDGTNAAVEMPFTVSVTAINQPPVVDAIAAQSMVVGENIQVAYNAFDPESDTLQASVQSSEPGIVTAAITQAGLIDLAAQSAGQAAVTLSVEDGNNPAVSVAFAVSVTEANQPPSLQPVGDQTIEQGGSLPIAYTATDPENDPLQVVATSDAPNIVGAAVTQPGVLTLQALAVGQATITLSAEDGNNPAVSVSFIVTVTEANQPPQVQPITDQFLTAGDSVTVNYSATDPNGDPLQATALSNAPNIVEASVTQPGVIALQALAAGQTTVSLSVEDMHNPAVGISFMVTVTEANQPPQLQPIGDQVLTAGQSLAVNYSATDPNGDSLQATAISNAPNIVEASVTQPGVITLQGVAAGQASVTLAVTDGVNPEVSVAFGVLVESANSAPTIGQIGPQSVEAGSSISVPLAVADADSDPLIVSAVSDNPAVATAVANGTVEVLVSGVTPGQANVTVDVDDGRGGTASTAFTVTVTGANSAPVIQPDPIPDQSLTVGEEIAVPISVTDPDNDPVVLTAISQNMGAVSAEAQGGNTIVLRGVAEGSATVEVTADDARGGITVTSFTVNVSSAAPTFDLMQYPVLPNISGPMAQTLGQVYQSGVSNFGNRAGAFVKIGDNPMDSQNFMVPYAGDQYQLGIFGSLQGLITAYASTPVREATDPATNSFDVDSIAAGADFGVDSLTAPAPGGAPCDAVGGGTALSCEIQLTRPAIALISFSAPNVTFMEPAMFRSELQSLVVSVLSEYGVIPVLATIPAGNGYSTEQLAEYNRAIVEVATESGVPLWNLWRAMQERGIADPNSVSPSGAGDLTDGSLGYGYNIRNLTALQSLEAVRQAVGIQ